METPWSSKYQPAIALTARPERRHITAGSGCDNDVEIINQKTGPGTAAEAFLFATDGMAALRIFLPTWESRNLDSPLTASTTMETMSQKTADGPRQPRNKTIGRLVGFCFTME